MQAIGSAFSRVGLSLAIALLSLVGCSMGQSREPSRAVQISQSWELQPGDRVAGRRIAGGLGDISIDLQGGSVYAPFDGRVQPNTAGCVIFSTAEIPAYLFRLCGLSQPHLGTVQRGEAFGSADYLQFAALRRQPDGKWALVEPSSSILEQTLKQQ